MAKFVFRLQSVLNLKVSLENQQKNAFALAKRHLDEEQEKLERLYARKELYEEEGKRLRKDALNIRDICDNENALDRIKEFIEEQKKAVLKAEQALEEERQKLEEMMKDRKIYERLREKAFDEFLENEKHEENIITDERNSYVYGTQG